jgi:hypothetical protein
MNKYESKYNIIEIWYLFIVLIVWMDRTQNVTTIQQQWKKLWNFPNFFQHIQLLHQVHYNCTQQNALHKNLIHSLYFNILPIIETIVFYTRRCNIKNQLILPIGTSNHHDKIISMKFITNKMETKKRWNIYFICSRIW